MLMEPIGIEDHVNEIFVNDEDKLNEEKLNKLSLLVASSAFNIMCMVFAVRTEMCELNKFMLLSAFLTVQINTLLIIVQLYKDTLLSFANVVYHFLVCIVMIVCMRFYITDTPLPSIVMLVLQLLYNTVVPLVIHL